MVLTNWLLGLRADRIRRKSKGAISRKRKSARRKSLRSVRSRASQIHVEFLESRILLTASASITPGYVTFGSVPAPTPSSQQSQLQAIDPAQMQKAYGIDQISFGGTKGNGAGQTIAIVDLYHDPNLLEDANTFSSTFNSTTFNLPQFQLNVGAQSGGGPMLTVLNEYGGNENAGAAAPQALSPANLTQPNAVSWAIEESLDVEWAHAIAPMANIVVVEGGPTSGTAPATNSDLIQAIETAESYPGVSVVSMSFSLGGSNGQSELTNELALDSQLFTTPGVTFLAATGDGKAGQTPAGYPSFSPDVIAVGGSTLTVPANWDGTYQGETGWYDSGGGVSQYETQPSYQSNRVNGTSQSNRTVPDVSMDAGGATIGNTSYDKGSYAYVVDSYDNLAGNGPWWAEGGTSLSTPMWAGLIAIANQGRAANGLPALTGSTQTLPLLYSLPSSDFNNITSVEGGSTDLNGFAAQTGYDLVTGLGSPQANSLVGDLVADANIQQIDTGDVTPVDLSVAAPGGSSYSITGFDVLDPTTGQYDPLTATQDANGNWTLSYNGTNVGYAIAGGPVDGVTYPDQRKFYFAPATGDGLPFDIDSADSGFQGTIKVDFTFVNQLAQSTTASTLLEVNPGYSTQGSNALQFDGSTLDTYRLQQRLNFLGFPDENGNPLALTGTLNQSTDWAIGLFNAAMTSTDPDPNATAINQQWINAADAPQWEELSSTGGTGWQNTDDPANNPGGLAQDWGTNWTAELIEQAGEQNQSGTPLSISSVSLPMGGPTDNTGQQSGMQISVATASGEVDPATGQWNAPFYLTVPAPSGTYQGETLIAAASPASDPNTQYIIYFNTQLNNGQGGYEADPISDLGSLTLNPVIHSAANLDNEGLLEGIAPFLVDNSAIGYSLATVEQQIKAFANIKTADGATVQSIEYGDPRTWTMAGVPADFVQFGPNLGGHFQVNISPPGLPANVAGSQPPSTTTPPASQGTVGSTTASDVATELAAGFNTFAQQDLSGLADEFNLSSSSLPFVDPSIATNLNLPAQLESAVQQLSLTGINTMAELEMDLENAGFTINLAVDDPTTLPSGTPADFIRATQTYALSNLTDPSIASAGWPGIQGLTGTTPSGDLGLSGDFQFTLTIGVDTAGFYILPGPILGGQLNASGTLTADIGTYGSLSGDAQVNLNPQVILSTTNADGRLRLSDLSQLANIASVADSGTADLNVNFTFESTTDDADTGSSPITFGGHWQWQIGSGSYQLGSSGSGFDTDSLYNSIVGVVDSGINDLSEQANTVGAGRPDSPDRRFS